MSGSPDYILDKFHNDTLQVRYFKIVSKVSRKVFCLETLHFVS